MCTPRSTKSNGMDKLLPDGHPVEPDDQAQRGHDPVTHGYRRRGNGRGKVTGVWMRQYQGDQQQLLIQGTVTEDQLAVTIEGKARQEKKIPWDDRVLGLYGQERLFREHKVKSGESTLSWATSPASTESWRIG